MSGLKLIFLGLGVSAVLLVLSVSLPLLTYTVSLAVFGLMHVTSELSYVRARFGPRVKRDLAVILSLLLVAVIVIRSAIIMKLLPVKAGHLLEVSVIFLLCMAVIPAIRRHTWASGAAMALAVLLMLGLFISPAYTLLVLAILHNWTPVAFIAEATKGPQRFVAMITCTVVFAAMPVFIATGIPYAMLSYVGLSYLETSILPAGPLAMHLGVYVPAFLHAKEFALHAFSAVVFAQVMHYVTVIHVLPRLLVPSQKTGFSWPILALCALLLLGFVADFSQARAIYGIASAVHAWLEIPILLIGLASLQKVHQQTETKRSAVSDQGHDEAFFVVEG